jgi:cystathionine beta-lyase/cystathionine gamma-synthase
VSKDRNPDTIAVSAGRMTREHFGSVNTPVYRTSTVLFPDIHSLRTENQPYIYGRRGTPTSRSFESVIAELEGGARCVALPSGLNAIATAILSVCGTGDHLLMADTCYGPTRHRDELLRSPDRRRHCGAVPARHARGLLRKPRLADLRDPGRAGHREGGA